MIQFHQGFTLVELLVVIGIIGVLSGILLASMSGGSESARAAQCLSNLRNLAAACQTYGGATGRYPLAGSIEYATIDESKGIAHAKALYHEVPGWISWLSKGAYRQGPNAHQASSSWFSSAYATDDEERLYALTNGVLWKYVSGNKNVYVCPNHAKKAPKLGRPNWSYVMNAYFGWDTSEGSEAQGASYSHIRYGDLARADRVLLFSELQYLDCGLEIPQGEGSGKTCDCVLQYSESGQASSGTAGTGANAGANSSDNELIGVNHVNGRNLFAHVAFADGHVEKLRIPYSGSIKNPQVESSLVKNLTTWLCTGSDVSFDGKTYKLMEN